MMVIDWFRTMKISEIASDVASGDATLLVAPEPIAPAEDQPIAFRAGTRRCRIPRHLHDGIEIGDE
jgi:hypothetical protein